MTFLEVLALTGYSLGAWVHLWIGLLVVRQRWQAVRQPEQRRLENTLLALTASVGIWHACNFALTLFYALGLNPPRHAVALRLIDSLLVIGITLAYSLLLHVHLHLWARTNDRELTKFERARVFLSYLPLLFIYFAVNRIWAGEYALMFEKLRSVSIGLSNFDFVLAFAVWSNYVLLIVALTDLMIARRTNVESERRMMRTLATSFLIIGGLILIVHGFGFNRRTTAGAYLETLANLGSLLPTALLTYYIYRYRYLEIIIKRTIIAATLAVAIAVLYLYGVQTAGAWLARRYALRAGVIETLLTLGIALAAFPLRQLLERKLQRLFARETELYKGIVNRISASAWQHNEISDTLFFIAQHATKTLELNRLNFVLDSSFNDSCFNQNQNDVLTSDAVSPAHINGKRQPSEAKHETLANDESNEAWLANFARLTTDKSYLEDVVFGFENYDLAFPLRHETTFFGAMLVRAPEGNLTPELQQTLGVLAAQVSLALEKSRLIEENSRLERRVAHGERLAALGQMTATVAHEIKNPLSSIKSIAQVMREDETLASNYNRDLDLIIGETNRLNRSLTQMLNWTRNERVDDDKSSIELERLISTVVALYQSEAEARNVKLETNLTSQIALPYKAADALHDALSNLTLNALQAAPAGSTVKIHAKKTDDVLIVTVTDEGAGIPINQQQTIWEPFFTTKQQGTGLGLSIARKRLREIGGDVGLIEKQLSETGATFRITLRLI